METIYRKYRPKNFSEVEGQTHIVRTLKNAVRFDRIGHAYLFTGPRGTGKTTLARIFALAVNCLTPKDGEPCGTCVQCINSASGISLSTLEIDAASNTGVDNIRQLRDEALLLPIDGACYKMYIIDEVHMLSHGAFNALLKILEEPPKHIIFILATTELHKVPETIVSRCQRFDFGKIATKHIIQKLSRIAKKENVRLDKEVLEMVAVASEGGMRDAESLLAQLFSANDTHITAAEAEEILGFSHRHTADAFLSALISGNARDALQRIQEASEGGYNLDIFAQTIIHALRRLLLLQVSSDFERELKSEMTEEELARAHTRSKSVTISWVVRAIDTLLITRLAMKSSFLPQIPIETAAIKIIHPETVSATPTPSKSEASNLSPSDSSPAKIAGDTAHKQPEKAEKTIQIKQLSKATITKNNPDEINATPKKEEKNCTLNDVFAVWQQCIDQTAEKNALLGTFLKSSVVSGVDRQTITILTQSDFSKNKLEDTANRLTIESILGTLLGTRVSLSVQRSSSQNGEVSSSGEDTLLQNVLETFGTSPA